MGRNEDSVAEVARSFGVGWHATMAAVRDHCTPLVDDPARLDGVGALGLDETRFLAATPTHHSEYVTGFVDLDRPRLLDVVAGRSAKAVEDWLGERPDQWLAGIDVVAPDPIRGYANGLLDHLGHATVVVDHFHAIRLANKAIDRAGAPAHDGQQAVALLIRDVPDPQPLPGHATSHSRPLRRDQRA